MNKTFNKIAAAFVGMAMAIGVGVAVSHDAKALEARAEDVLVYTLDGTDKDQGSSGYAVASDITQSDIAWKVTANTTISPWRFGGKNLTETTRTAESQAALSTENISYVVVKTGNATATVHSASLLVGTAIGGNDIASLTLTEGLTNAELEFLRPEGQDWSNKYFTIAFNVSCGGSNQYIQLENAKFYKTEGGEQPTDATVASVAITGAPQSFEGLNLEQSFELVASATLRSGEGEPTFTWASSNNNVAKVNKNGVLTLVGNGEVSITATANIPAGSEEGDTNVGTLSFTVSELHGSLERPYTIAEAKAAIDNNIGKTGAHVAGIVSKVDSYDSKYYSITYWISDNGSTEDQFEVYSGKDIGGANFEDINGVKVGDLVVVKGNIKAYGDIYEFDYNNELVTHTERSVTGISVTAPTKINYGKPGQELDLTGMVVYAKFAGEAMEAVSDYTVSEVDMSTSGEKTVTVYYGGFEESFKIYVAHSLAIAYSVIDMSTLEEAPAAIANLAQLPVEAYKGDEVVIKAEAAEGYYVLGISDEAGDFAADGSELTFTMPMTALNFSIMVAPASTIPDHLEVTAPDKINYRPGETVDPTGMKVYVIAKDNSRMGQLNLEDCQVTLPELTEAGTKQILVSYTSEGITLTGSTNVYVARQLTISYVVIDVTTYEAAEEGAIANLAELPAGAYRGDEVTISAVAGEGYEILGMNDEVGDFEAEGAELTFTMPMNDLTFYIFVNPVQPAGRQIVYGIFDWDTYEADPAQLAHYVDMVESTLPSVAAPGTEVTVSIVMNDGYAFGSAFSDEGLYADEATFTFTMPEAPEGEEEAPYIIALFADRTRAGIDYYAVNYVTEEPYSVSEVLAGSTLPDMGDEEGAAAIDFVVADGYLLFGWYPMCEDDSFYDQLADYYGDETHVEVTMGEESVQWYVFLVTEEQNAEPVELQVVNQQKDFNLNDEFTLGEDALIGAIHYVGYDLLSVEDVTIAGYDMSKAGKQTVTVTYGELSFEYEIVVHDPHQVSVLADKGARVMFTTIVEGGVDPDGIVRFVINFAEYCSLDAVAVVTANGDEIAVSQQVNQISDAVSYYFTMPAEDVTIIVSVSNELENAKDRAAASLDAYRASFDETQYEQAGVEALDAAVATGKGNINAATTLEAVQEALNNAKAALDAVATKTLYQVNKDAGEGASIVLINVPEAGRAEGSDVRFGITLEEGYELVSYKVTGESGAEIQVNEEVNPISGAKTYVFTMPGENVTITVVTRNPAAEALAQAKQDAIDELEAFFATIDQSKYDDNGKKALADAKQAGIDAINACESIEQLNQLVADAKAALEAVQQKAPAKKGCGGSIAATSIILSTLALAGAGLLVFKKKEEK